MLQATPRSHLFWSLISKKEMFSSKQCLPAAAVAGPSQPYPTRLSSAQFTIWVLKGSNLSSDFLRGVAPGGYVYDCRPLHIEYIYINRLSEHTISYGWDRWHSQHRSDKYRSFHIKYTYIDPPLPRSASRNRWIPHAGMKCKSCAT